MNVCDMNVFNVVIKTRYTYLHVLCSRVIAHIVCIRPVFVDYKKKES